MLCVLVVLVPGVVIRLRVVLSVDFTWKDKEVGSNCIN